MFHINMSRSHPTFISLDVEDRITVSMIADECPYNIETIAKTYIKCGKSENVTRENLQSVLKLK